MLLPFSQPLGFAWGGAKADVTFAGSGTAGDPYQISSVEQLQELSTLSNSGTWSGSDYQTAYYKLTADLDMSEVENFTPICHTVTTSNGFNGSFDGDGHTISNLKITVATDNEGHIGLIGCLQAKDDAPHTVKNLILKTVTITNNFDDTESFSIGGLVGRTGSCTIENCAVIGFEISKENAKESYCGNAPFGYLSSSGSSILKFCSTDDESLLAVMGGKAVNNNSVTSTGTLNLATSENLVYFSKFVNAGVRKISGKLTADIDMSVVSNFTPIGLTSQVNGAAHNNNKYAYRGTFDGQGHTISNLTIAVDDEESWQVGLFGRIFTATVKNLGLKTVSITQTSSTAAAAGALAGRNGSSTVQNCYAVDVNLTQTAPSTSVTNSTAASGLVGYMSGSEESKIINCYTDHNRLTVLGTSNNVTATATNCYSGSVTALGIEAIGERASTGELCYLLNGDQSNIVWKQNLSGTADAHPVLDSTHDKVNKATSSTTDYYYNGTVASMTLTDKADYAADANFTAESLTYNRTLEAGGYNSLCLPFAIDTDMLSAAGGKLFTVKTVGDDAITLEETPSVAAGVPCFASVTSDFNFNTLDLKNVPMKSGVTNGTNLKGTFTEITGADAVGIYKLSSDGTYFGLTTDGAVVKPFRSYIQPSAASVKTLNILLSDGTSLTPTLSEEREAVVYDLAGRRVEKATKGLYIINGKKVVK